MASFELQKKIFQKVAPIAMEEAQRLLSRGPYQIQRSLVFEREVLHFSHSPPTLGAFFAEIFEHASPSDEFIVCDDERMTYKEAGEKILALRWALRNKFGLRKGDRVAIVMPNYPEWILSFIAVTWEGGVAVALNGWWKEKELHYGFRDSEAKILICDTKLLKRTTYSLTQKGDKKTNLQTVLVAQTSRDIQGYKEVVSQISEFLKEGEIMKFEDCLGKLSSMKNEEIVETDDMSAIFYTSGTTGFPKGVVLTHRAFGNQLHLARFGKMMTAWTEKFGKSIALGSPPPPPPSSALPSSYSGEWWKGGVDEGERLCLAVPVPLFHVTGTFHIFLAAMLGWGKLVLMPKWSASKALKLIEKEKINDWTGVPTLITDLLESLKTHPNVDLSSLKKVAGGGAQFTPALIERTKGSKLPYNHGQGYGLTETSGGIAVISGISFLLNPDTTGPLTPICEGVIVDPETLERKGVDEEGELLVKSCLIMKGYFNKDEATKKAIVALPHPETGKPDPGWFRTGDLARINKEGLVFIVGRKKELVIRGGENISCNEVEAAIAQHWGVAECTVFPLPDPRLGERVAAAIHPRHECFITGQMVLDFLKEKNLLAPFKMPTDIFFSGSALPRTASGKIAKRLVSKSILEIEEEKKKKAQPKL